MTLCTSTSSGSKRWCNTLLLKKTQRRRHFPQLLSSQIFQNPLTFTATGSTPAKQLTSSKLFLTNLLCHLNGVQVEQLLSPLRIPTVFSWSVTFLVSRTLMWTRSSGWVGVLSFWQKPVCIPLLTVLIVSGIFLCCHGPNCHRRLYNVPVISSCVLNLVIVL